MQTWKRILSCIAALCLTAGLLGALTWLTQKKDSYAKHAEFFEQDADYDVFFVGSSRMMNGVFPMELWNDHGIVSYNWAQAGHPPPAYYWIMRLALDYKQPKLMVIDCYGMHFDAKTTAVFGLMHISMDSFPLSLNKIRAVRDLMDDPFIGDEYNEGERRSGFNLLWTFPVFHSRWNQLTAEDFHPQKNYTRGAIANSEMYGTEFVRDESQSGRVFDTVGVEYLRRAVEECQSRGIQVLMTFIPLYADAEQQAAARYAGQIAAEYGVDYINFFDLDLVDYLVDFADSAGHLNTAGARKITKYVGDYITEHYGIPDHRGESAYANWERDYALYTEKKNEELRAQEELYHYLMLLTRDTVDAALFVDDTGLFSDPIAAELLTSLGVEREKLSDDVRLIVLRNGGERSAVLTELPRAGETTETPAGTLVGGEPMTLDGMPLESAEGDLGVCVLRGGDVIDKVSFGYVYDPASGRIDLLETKREAE